MWEEWDVVRFENVENDADNAPVLDAPSGLCRILLLLSFRLAPALMLPVFPSVPILESAPEPTLPPPLAVAAALTVALEELLLPARGLGRGAVDRAIELANLAGLLVCVLRVCDGHAAADGRLISAEDGWRMQQVKLRIHILLALH